MSKITIDIDPDQMDTWVRNELRRCYTDNATVWHNEPNSERLGDALLTVIEHYSNLNEFENWYETIKDL